VATETLVRNDQAVEVCHWNRRRLRS